MTTNFEENYKKGINCYHAFMETNTIKMKILVEKKSLDIGDRS